MHRWQRLKPYTGRPGSKQHAEFVKYMGIDLAELEVNSGPDSALNLELMINNRFTASLLTHFDYPAEFGGQELGKDRG